MARNYEIEKRFCDSISFHFRDVLIVCRSAHVTFGAIFVVDDVRFFRHISFKMFLPVLLNGDWNSRIQAAAAVQNWWLKIWLSMEAQSLECPNTNMVIIPTHSTLQSWLFGAYYYFVSHQSSTKIITVWLNWVSLQWVTIYELVLWSTETRCCNVPLSVLLIVTLPGSLLNNQLKISRLGSWVTSLLVLGLRV